ncbi:MAG: type VI secretion system ImpA family N-terminal domain-containing protein [Pseudomonadota bacterium]
MMALDLDAFIGQVSPDSPCGEDLEYDPVFEQMARDAEGTPERQLGESITPAEEPDWKSVRALGLELLQRSRDIRVSVLLTRALVHTEGFEGVDQGLILIHELLRRYWDDVHPRQDPDDDYPIQHINTLADLNDYARLLNPVSRIPLTDSQAVGRFS